MYGQVQVGIILRVSHDKLRKNANDCIDLLGQDYSPDQDLIKVQTLWLSLKTNFLVIIAPTLLALATSPELRD